MENNPIIEKLKEEFKSGILEVIVKNQNRIIVTVKPDSLLNAAEYLYKSAGFRFIIASAIHTKRGFEIHYHFSKDSDGLILNLHVINASNWIEREMHELFGIDFLNHPNQDKLISEGNWAEGVYPYRKEFKSISEEKE
jgi:Ni,Fe-hydrogenase III component G